MIKRVGWSIMDFLRLESAGGTLLLAATVLGLLCANSPLRELYKAAIGSLAFVSSGMEPAADERIGIIGGSPLSAVFGYMLLRCVLARPPESSR